mgnify:CR=1 FL=1
MAPRGNMAQQAASAARPGRLGVAILILAHTNPEQLLRLTAHLQSDFDVFIHLDRASTIRIEDFRTFHRATVFKKFKARWGSLAIVHAMLELLARSSAAGPYDRYVFISGLDVPLMSNRKIAEHFSAHRDTDFVDIQRFVEGEESRLTRLTRFHFFSRRTSAGEPARLRGAASRLIDRALHQAGVRRTNIYDFRWGSQWMDLTRETAESIVHFVNNDRRFLRRFRFTFCPDEFLCQTAIQQHPYTSRKKAKPARFIDWDTGPERPRVLRTEDLDQIIASGMLFARKCDSRVDSALVDRLFTFATAEEVGEV